MTLLDDARQYDGCPESGRHTPAPKGFREWHEWAGEKSRTHHQIQCPGCGLWTIWVRNEGETGLTPVFVDGTQDADIATPRGVTNCEETT